MLSYSNLGIRKKHLIVIEITVLRAKYDVCSSLIAVTVDSEQFLGSSVQVCHGQGGAVAEHSGHFLLCKIPAPPLATVD